MNYKAQAKLVNGIDQQFGFLGSKAITGTDAVTPDTGYEWVALQFVEDSVVAAYAQPSSAVDSVDLTAFTTISAGTTIYGRFSSITLTSGSAIGYNGKSQSTVD